jgi:hypothetical protein
LHGLKAERDPSMASLAMLCIGFTMPALDHSDCWEKERRLLPHAMQWFESASGKIDIDLGGTKYNLTAASNLANLYLDQGKLVEAEAVHGQILEGKIKWLGQHGTSMLRMVNNLGDLKRKQGNMSAAESMYNIALEGKRLRARGQSGY